MRTRNTDAQKSAGATKRTPPAAKKSAAKTQATPSSAEVKVESSPTQTETPKTSEVKRASAGRTKQVSVTPDSKAQPSVEQVGPASAVAKPVSGTKIVKKVVRKVIRKTPVSARAASVRTTASAVIEKAKIEETTEDKTIEDEKNTEASNDEPTTDEKPLVENVEHSVVEDKDTSNIGKFPKEDEKASEPEKQLMDSGEELSEAIGTTSTDANPVEDQEPCMTNETEELEEEKGEQSKTIGEGDPKAKTMGMEGETSHEGKRENASLEEPDDGKIEGLSDQEVHEEFGGEDCADDDAPQNEADAETLEEERVQLNAAARERKVRKEREIFVGGLDRDAVEADVRKVFEYAGEVVEVRMHVDPSTNKNKGYAFVQFATKEQASRALSEMKNPVIHGKRCGTAPSEDNDTLFLGNICNTWTKEAIKQKLKDYGIEGVENITLVADPRYEGLSRGFAFIEFSSHAEAMLAYKRLQKHDVVFGHSERTAKVAFAEPLREPDPEVMAQVKSVFIDGLPPHWDEDHVREKFKVFGDIARIMLARNMSTAKRKDFGFVDFSTHEAAVSCVEGVNNNGLNDGNSKVKVRARLSNPLPKMQAVKGGMCGGFRIAHSSSGTFPRFSGRSSGRGGRPFNRANFQHGRGFYPRGPGRGGRVGFPPEYEFDNPYPPFHGRPNFGRGGRWGFRGADQDPSPVRPYPDRVIHEKHLMNHTRMMMFAHGIKRPYYMMDQDPDLAEPSRHGARLDQSDPAVPFRGTRYHDDLGSDGGLYRQNYYGREVKSKRLSFSCLVDEKTQCWSGGLEENLMILLHFLPLSVFVLLVLLPFTLIAVLSFTCLQFFILQILDFGIVFITFRAWLAKGPSCR
ncbi:Heterogeneous nuclear ribonucleoprotein Q [Sesamum alatum]|uniref:Heterogeneous nuclear ribonucleoprotein Q n=1 Tax=Sesamum alatum TaxID=300844 RepID=A0AAE2CCB5_9LAMI|nr:Heterogeneous nuclear ribonucleoprotein Q [Sesamum alatum]